MLENLLQKFYKENNYKTLPSKTIICTFLGCVDNGKTTMFEKMCCQTILKNEYNSITQTIYQGVSSIEYKEERYNFIFLDSPGHENFTTMRKICSNISNFIIIVVSPFEVTKKEFTNYINFVLEENDLPFIIVLTKLDKYSDESRLFSCMLELGLDDSVLQKMENFFGIFQIDYSEYGLKAFEFSTITRKKVNQLKEYIVECCNTIENCTQPDIDENLFYVVDAVNIPKYGMVNLCIRLNTNFVEESIFLQNEKINITTTDNYVYKLKMKQILTPDCVVMLSKERNKGCIFNTLSLKENYNSKTVNILLKIVLVVDTYNKIGVVQDLITQQFPEVKIIHFSCGTIEMIALKTLVDTNKNILILGFNHSIEKEKIQIIKRQFLFEEAKSIYEIKDVITENLDLIKQRLKLQYVLKNNISLGEIIEIFNLNFGCVYGCDLKKGSLSKTDSLTVVSNNKIKYEKLKIKSLCVKTKIVDRVEANIQVGILFVDKTIRLDKKDIIIVTETIDNEYI